jgi:putative tricarboxylic transport membrane protein
MVKFNRDSVVAIILLLLCGILFYSSFDIRQPDYGVLMPSTWPRIIIAVLALLSSIYLIQSLRARPDEKIDDDLNIRVDAFSITENKPGIMGFFDYWRNPIICFSMFFLFLITLPIFGMLIGGLIFVFTLMSLLGGWKPRKLMTHAAISILTVGAMWSLFTFVLGVMLPVGIIFNPFAL